jgi:hypothetical protein
VLTRGEKLGVAVVKLSFLYFPHGIFREFGDKENLSRLLESRQLIGERTGYVRRIVDPFLARHHHRYEKRQKNWFSVFH